MYLLLAALLSLPIHFTADPNYCIDVPSGIATGGAKLQLWKCNGTPAQDFSMTPATSTPATPAPVASTLVDPATPAKDGYHAVFSDEFNAATLDLTKWNLLTDGSGGGNNEQQYYLPFPANHFVSGSNLTIRVKKQSFLGQPYTSAKLTTMGLFDFTYGWVEARIKVPKGQGLWPAFWCLPKDYLYGQWPTSGEIDIMEILGGDPGKLYGTAHFGAAWPNQLQLGGQQTATAGTDYSQDFHTFAVDWQTDHITWYLDGVAYYTMRNTDGNWQTGNQGAVPSKDWPFNIPNYVILNMAMGGQWPGAPDASITQGDMLIDYVRVYQAN